MSEPTGKKYVITHITDLAELDERQITHFCQELFAIWTTMQNIRELAENMRRGPVLKNAIPGDIKSLVPHITWIDDGKFDMSVRIVQPKGESGKEPIS